MSSLMLAGDTSGTLTLTVPATAGTNTITLPASTGTAITTASTSGIPGTVNWTTVQTSSVSPAVAGTGYPMNTTSGALTVTLPAAPVAGNLISIVDYAGTAATNNITINPNGLKINGGTNNALISVNREAINLVYVDSTQGWLAYADVYSTTNPIPQPYTVSYLIVAGGGSGAVDHAGGAGAGGLVTGTTSLTPGTVYTAVVGAGAALVNGSSVDGNNGSNSTFTGLTTAVGGAAGAKLQTNGFSGGSGGGGGGYLTSQTTGGSGTPGQGNAGGTSSASGSNNNRPSGGGGGAGAVGGNGTTPGISANGGAGTASSITGTPATYAGGGGGGMASSGTTAGSGGAGGGGAGGYGPANATAGTVNTGGGGGGAGGSIVNSGAGGSGVVILSVPTANYSGTTTGSPTITTSGANTIIKYTSGSGTYTA